MELLKKTLFILIPITLLLCLMAYGMQTIFGIEGLTYLEQKCITCGHLVNDCECTIQDQQLIWQFNFSNYIKALDIEEIKTIFQKTFDIETFKEILTQLKNLWADGYDFGDIFKSVIYGFEGVIDGIIMTINFVIAIFRTIVALFRYLISLAGININADIGILNILKYIVELAQIPYIPVTTF